jgi:DNA-binding response OmpR family regulator
MTTLLLYGLDPSLLEVRRMLLKAAGFEVIAIGSLEQLRSPDAPVQLVVLCHTLPDTDCEQVLGIAERRWPQAKELILAPLGGQSECAGHANESFAMLEGPARLIARVRELVTSAPAIPVLR